MRRESKGSAPEPFSGLRDVAMNRLRRDLYALFVLNLLDQAIDAWNDSQRPPHSTDYCLAGPEDD